MPNTPIPANASAAALPTPTQPAALTMLANVLERSLTKAFVSKAFSNAVNPGRSVSSVGTSPLGQFLSQIQSRASQPLVQLGQQRAGISRSVKTLFSAPPSTHSVVSVGSTVLNRFLTQTQARTSQPVTQVTQSHAQLLTGINRSVQALNDRWRLAGQGRDAMGRVTGINSPVGRVAQTVGLGPAYRTGRTALQQHVTPHLTSGSAHLSSLFAGARSSLQNIGTRWNQSGQQRDAQGRFLGNQPNFGSRVFQTMGLGDLYNAGRSASGTGGGAVAAGGAALSFLTNRSGGGGLLGLILAPVKIAAGIFAGALAVGSGALFLFVRSVQGMTREMVQVAREITAIRNNTGRGIGDSMKGYFGLRAAGFSGASASGFLSQAGPLGDARSRAWNLPSMTDPGFALRLAEKSQGMSFFGRKAMLESISGGQASPELLQLANSRPESIKREQGFLARTQNALGVTPEAIRRLSDEWPLFQNRVSMFTETVKMRFISSMLPLMEQGMDRLSVVLESNSGRISKAIENGTRWLYVDLPGHLVTGARVGLNAIEMISEGFFNFADGLAGFLRAIGEGQSGLFSFFEFIGSVIDSMMASAKFLGLTDKQTDIAGDMQNWRNSGTPENLAKNIEAFTQSGRDKTGSALDWARGVLDETDKFLGSRDQRDADFSSSLKELTAATKDGHAKIVGAIEKTNESGQGTDSVLQALKGHIGKESFIVASR
jgi:hypothetical protein